MHHADNSMNNWKLHVEGLGKIKNADIEVSPFNMFIGDNNSGKSYVMTVIYGLLNVRFFFSKYEIDETSDAYQKCRKIAENMMYGADYDERFFSPEQIGYFNEVLNQILERNKEKFMEHFFNRKISVKNVSVKLPYLESFKVNIRSEYQQGKDYRTLFCSKEDGNYDYELSGIGLEVDGMDSSYRFIITYIIESLLKIEYCNMGYPNIVYLPTSRTGFLLTFRTLATSSIEDKFTIRKAEKNLLTKPCSDFLVNLANSVQNGESGSVKYEEIISYIEHDMISGHITVEDGPSMNVTYLPDGNTTVLPMYVTSGVVTELTPLLLLLKTDSVGTVMMEEPEMCLHPGLQWKMIRTMIRIYNQNTPVFITTHSDIILSHINNIVQIGNKTNRRGLMEKFGYQEEDMINQDDISIYQFTSNNDGTVIEKLSCGPMGFLAPTFQSPLQLMLEQLEDINEDD